MTHLMSHSISEISKCFLTVTAGELLLSIVDSHVIAQMQLGFEQFCTNLALELRSLNMIGHVRF